MPFHIINCGNYDGILGRQFLMTNKALIDTVNHYLILQLSDTKSDTKIPLGTLPVNVSDTLSHQPPHNPTALLINSITIPTVNVLHFHPVNRLWTHINKIIYLLIQISIIMTLMAFSLTSPNIGSLYNCDITQYKGAYSLSPMLPCSNSSQNTSISAFHASVLRYHPQIITLKPYHCTAKKMQLTCNESFFGTKEKHTHILMLKISTTACRQAVTKNQSSYGPLIKSSAKEWFTKTHPKNVCKWFKNNTAKNTLFEYTSCEVTLSGNEKFMHQALPQTVCHDKIFYFIPRKYPYTQIILNNVIHRPSLYRNFGRFPIKRFRDFLLIPRLGMRGSLIPLLHLTHTMCYTPFRTTSRGNILNRCPVCLPLKNSRVADLSEVPPRHLKTSSGIRRNVHMEERILNKYYKVIKIK